MYMAQWGEWMDLTISKGKKEKKERCGGEKGVFHVLMVYLVMSDGLFRV